jgi:hypothetical protein
MIVDFKVCPYISYIITVLLFIILIIIISARYAPSDQQGYYNYYRDVHNMTHSNAIGLIVFILVIIVILVLSKILYTIGEMKEPSLTINLSNWRIGWLIYSVKTLFIADKLDKSIIEILKWICFYISITLVFNLMNIVMTFRFNTTPILKTKPLNWSLRNSLSNHINHRYNPDTIVLDPLDPLDPIKPGYTKVFLFQSTENKKKYIEDYYTIVKKESFKTDITYNTETKVAIINEGKLKTDFVNPGQTVFNNISSVLDIYIAFEELSKMVFNSLHTKTKDYTQKLNDTIIKSILNDTTADTSKLSLIFDREVDIPNDYGDEGSVNEHNVNSNHRNEEYEYTADISYGNANVFYEKYWDMKDSYDNFLNDYTYFVPNNLANVFKVGINLYWLMLNIVIFIIILVVVLIIAIGIYNYIMTTPIEIKKETIFEIVFPLIAFVVFVTYIIVFIRFNTNFNKNVVYKCLDCSYKRSLNKLNTIVTPYIRMYDNKITGGNKDYTHHYIIANVFYSILSGNINLLDDASIVSSVKVTAGGSGYTSAPAVVFNPSGASATAILGTGVDVDKVVSINVTNGGSYTSVPPIITFTPANGGAVASANITGGYINSISINDNDDIDYNLYKSKLADMDSNLTNENDYREYYKTKFKDLYNTKNKDDIDKIYNVFTCVFGYVGGSIITAEGIDTYFKTNIIKKSLISKIYLIIKRCIQLFEEELKNKNKPEILKYFKFYKNKDELIPHKFILILKTKTDYDAFINVTSDFENILEKKLNIAKGSTDSTDMTSILNDITDEDSTNQNKDIQSKCIIKIIAKYLLIMGHINYNRIDYISTSSLNKFSIDTLGLYKLISNVSYADTFVIDDTFGKDLKKLNLLTNLTYSRLTYMYNYLDTKFVNLSSNNNKNYLINIIKSINNTLNNDNKTIDLDDIKESRYLFRDRIKDIDEKRYENEEEILNNAHYISTTSFESTYFINMFIILFYIVVTVFIKIK